MSKRTLVTAIVYLVCFALLFAGFPQGGSEPAKFAFLFAALAVYLTLKWLRDRYFPLETVPASASPEKPVSHALGKSRLADMVNQVRLPWPTFYTCMCLVFVPVLLVWMEGIDISRSALEFIARACPFWSALITTLGLLWVRIPAGTRDRFLEWWLPCTIIVVLGVVGMRGIPGLMWQVTYGITDGPGTDITLAPANVPAAVLVWKFYRNRRITPGNP